MTPIIETRALSIIRQELHTKFHFVQSTSTGFKVRCPFHEERTPSCIISTGGRFPIGFFKCFGCGEKGSWNKLARRINARVLDDGDINSIENVNKDNVHYKINEMLREKDISWASLDPHLKDQPLFSLNDSLLGLKKSFLEKFGCKRFLDPETGEAFIVIPGHVHGSARCLVKARIMRKKRKPNYLTSMKSIGLLGFDEAINLDLYKRDRILFVVEGVRDALKMIQNNIPACALLGVQWNKIKEDIIASGDPNKVVLLLDNDLPGLNASRKIMDESMINLPLRNLRLPFMGDVGYKIDPASLSKKEHEQLYEEVLS